MKKIRDRKKVWMIAGVLLVLAVIVFISKCVNEMDVETFGNKVSEEMPTLIVETPQKVSLSQTDTLTMDLSITKLGDALYPAASFSIRFDPSRLEFLGVEEGNVFVQNASADSQVTQKLPEWSYNVNQSNESGLINIMYLDITGGNNAFCQELLAAEDNVVLRLSFRVRGSVRSGDIFDVTIEDAVFAASDETRSLAMAQNTIKIQNAKIIVGD